MTIQPLARRYLFSLSAIGRATGQLRTQVRVASTFSSDRWNRQRQSHAAEGRGAFSPYAAAAALAFLGASGMSLTRTQVIVSTEARLSEARNLPAGAVDGNTSNHAASQDELPVYRSSQVRKNDGTLGTPIWMSYGGLVYDVSAFIANHPGGSEKILMASGGALEPWWHIYRQHFASDLPKRYLSKMIIGRLDERDQSAIEEQLKKEMEEEEDPFANEPKRNPKLIVHSEQPMNAEVPASVITQSYITPSDLFYIRHHHPVPLLDDDEEQDYAIDIDLSAYGGETTEISLKDLKEKLEKVEVVTTMQCSGNRRGNFNETGDRTSGTPWGQGAVSTAKWGGVRLRDVLKLAGLDDPLAAEEKGFEHVRFESLDGMQASIGIEKACSPYGDTILAYEMNGEPLPRDHGFPLRAIVPGYSAVRNVKWISRIELATDEAEGPWQRGLNYKILPPSVRDAGTVNLDNMPKMMEVSLFSGITEIEAIKPTNMKQNLKAGDKVLAKAKGWAWAGGGRNIVRVDITGDGGKTWATADIIEGGNQKFGRSWAWVFWASDVPAVVGEDGKIELASKAVDYAFNVQPESCAHTWNVRG